MIDPKARIAEALKLRPQQIERVEALFAEGGTVPFIARYRKDHTDGLDEVQIRAIQEQLDYWQELQARQKSILESIDSQGLLTPELKARILAVSQKNELEDLYLPYKPRRRTRAQTAREQGLEPLALLIQSQRHHAHPQDEAKAFISAEVADADAALQGARDIVAEQLAERAEFRQEARDLIWKHGLITARKARGAESEHNKYSDYFDYSEPVSRIPSHRYLALRRGEKEKQVKIKIEVDAERLLQRFEHRLRRQPNAWGDQLVMALQDAWQRLLMPSLESEVLSELKLRSDERAIEIFASNLHELLMASPLGTQSVLGLDPGLRTGIKTVALSETGQLLEEFVLHPLRNEDQARQRFLQAVKRHQPHAIAIGDGTGSRETEQWVRQWIKADHKDLLVVRVSESGASIYSASDTAREEFPDLDLTVRGAISIGRRLQDPLAELVKIEPQALGVGQYQHDVNATALAGKLDQVVESCVNQVGVELNSASYHLLERVSGLSASLAKRVVDYRNQAGRFRSRAELKSVKGLGAKTFEQAAGFLRIRAGEHPLDNTAVHPEHYAMVEKMAQQLQLKVAELIAQPQELQKLDLSPFEKEVGKLTLADILQELQKPGRDPRAAFTAPSFRDDVQKIEDLSEGMKLQGKVTNVAAFGAFVDIGVHQDGLVHISELANRYVKDPHEVVKVGQTLNVTVLSVDARRKRIQLSAKDS